jgi:hypothetical protein
MKPDIIGKIAKLLEVLPIDDEPRTVYLLAEIRKVLDHEPSLEDELPTLRFYCNWALHTKLEGRAAQRFIAEVSPALMLGETNAKEYQSLEQLLTLQSFREELAAFLRRHSIDSSLCDNGDNWEILLRSYSRVVQDSELVVTGNMQASGPRNLSVQSVTIRPASALSLSPRFPYPMDWFVQYADGRRGTLTLGCLGFFGARMVLIA